MIKEKESIKTNKNQNNNKPKNNKTRKSLPFLCFDIVMKAVFIDEVNILAKMISDITGIEYKLLKDNTTLIANEIPISTKNEKAKRCDLVIKVNDGNIISLEANSSYYPGLLNKNLTYLFGEYVSIIKRSERYSENMYCIQIL